jgi:hypothetical protein
MIGSLPSAILVCLLAVSQLPSPISQLPTGGAWADIRDPVRIAVLWPWLLAAAAALALLAIGLYWWRRQRAARPPPGPPPEPAASRARRELAALATRTDELAAEPFAVAVSAVLRHYLEDALALPAPERTTDEFFAGLTDAARLDPPTSRQLREFLESCDLVKFARQDLAPGRKHELLAAATQVVDATDPARAPEVAA